MKRFMFTETINNQFNRSKKIILPIITAIFFISCTTVYLPSPQPEFTEELTEIPKEFQGEFWRIKSISEDGILDSNIYIVTENNIILNGETLNSESSVYKTWGNYFFLNIKEDSISNYWSCHIIHTNGLKEENEKIILKKINQDNVNWTYFDLKESNSNDTYISSLSTLQFHYLLRMSEGLDEYSEIHRIK
ncbi:MAG: hypothetical protein HOG85_00590 [Flavobacteriales bacterium]|jgi:hypothetical protein|nr:hypothetical protein [Flavobacteriales bacterium]